MKTSQITITEIESEADVQSYRDATGLVLAQGNFVVQGILNDTPEGIRIFLSANDAADYITGKVFAPVSTKASVKAGPKKPKRKYTKRAK